MGDTPSYEEPAQGVKALEREAATLIDQMNEGLAVMDENMRLTFVNDKFCRMLGYGRDELIGRPATDLHDHANQRALKVQIARQKKGEEGPYEIAFTRKDGRQFFANVSPRPKVDDDGRYKGSFAVVTDISKRVQMHQDLMQSRNLLEQMVSARTAQVVKANYDLRQEITRREGVEEQLRQSEERYRDLYENAPVAYFSVSSDDGSVLMCNPEALRLLGYEKDAIKGMKVFDLYADTSHGVPKAKKIFKSFQAGNSIRNKELQMKRSDGRPIWISLNVEPVKDPDGNVIESRSIVFDISRRRRAEQGLGESEQRYRILVETMNDGLAVFDNNDLNTYANDKFCQMLGYSSDEIIGHPASDFLDEVNKGILKKQIARRRKGKLGSYELVWTRKDGQTVSTIISPAPLFEENGHYAGAFAVIMDISERKLTEQELGESEERYRMLAEGMIDAVSLVDLDGRIRQVNREFERGSGWKREEAIGNTPMELGIISEQESQRISEEIVPKLLKEGVVRNLDLIVTRKDGTQFSASFNWTLIKDDLGNPSGIITVGRDLTDIQRAEQKLGESEQRYRMLVETMNEGLSVLDEKGRFKYLNDKCCEMFGYERDEVIGRPVEDFQDEANQAIFKKHFAIRKKGKRTSYEMAFIRKDGTQIPTIISGTPILDETGRFIGTFSVMTDITERKKMEEELGESEKRFRLLVETMNEALSVLDEKARVKYVNYKFCEMLGYQMDEIIGRPVGDFLTKSSRTIHAKHFSERKNGQSTRYEMTHLTKDGQEIPTTVSGAPILDDMGLFKGSFAVITDITERKEMEEELETKANNLEEMNTALKILLKKREEDKKELEEKVLSNVKGMVMPYLEKLKNSPLDEKQKAYAGILQSTLNEVISPFSRRLSSTYLNLTPTEIQVTTLIKQDKTSKEIAELLNTSCRTIEAHRRNIRKKLGLNRKKANLRTHLLSIQ
jgi:PAS domain S-box-containing protein